MRWILQQEKLKPVLFFYEDKVIIVVLGKRKNAGTVKFLWGEYVYIVPNFAVIDCTVAEICLVYFA